MRWQTGLNASLLTGKMLFEYHLFLGGKRLVLWFSDYNPWLEDDFAMVRYNVLSINNKLEIGKSIWKSSKKIRQIFLVGSLGIELNTVNSVGGGVNISAWDFNGIFEEYPDLPQQYNSVTLGATFKYRTRTNFLGLFDIGLTYDHSFSRHPPLGMDVLIGKVIYSARVVPYLDYFSIDFIKYFHIRKRNQKWERIRSGDY